MSIRSDRTARRYLGVNAPELLDADGFVTTPDAVEFREGRWVFAGRSDGVVNVGGFKVHPEEVEAILNRHEYVQMSHVKARRNPITGEIIVADVVLNARDVDLQDRDRHTAIREEILKMCRSNLPPHKVPATIRFVETLEISAGGKLVRHA
jgi:acyl-coenzyme A synthetase/AMP-(fatty) acid ligase